MTCLPSSCRDNLGCLEKSFSLCRWSSSSDGGWDKLLTCGLPSGVAGAGLVKFMSYYGRIGLSAENQVLAKYLGGWGFPTGLRHFGRLCFGLLASYSGGMWPGASCERLTLNTHTITLNWHHALLWCWSTTINCHCSIIFILLKLLLVPLVGSMTMKAHIICSINSHQCNLMLGTQSMQTSASHSLALCYVYLNVR